MVLGLPTACQRISVQSEAEAREADREIRARSNATRHSTETPDVGGWTGGGIWAAREREGGREGGAEREREWTIQANDLVITDGRHPGVSFSLCMALSLSLCMAICRRDGEHARK